MPKTLFICALFTTCIAHAQIPELVKNINTGLYSGSNGSNMSVFGNKLFFEASDGIHGIEPWITDGTDTGTHMIVDLNPTGDGCLGWYNISPVVVNNKVFFFGNDVATGLEPWVTDGTAAGTQLLKDIYTGTGGSSIQTAISYKSKIYFTAYDKVHVLGLWATNGTPGGTYMVKDLYDGFVNANIISAITEYNGKLFFANDDSLTGSELWVSDGTDTGTQRMVDINPGLMRGSMPAWFTPFNGKLYFTAYTDTYGTEVWVTDGTAAGTHMVKDIVPGNSNNNDGIRAGLTVCNGKLYFLVAIPSGSQLWVTDGTEAGTLLVTSINAISGSSDQNKMYAYNNKLYFETFDVKMKSELWASDGTATGTKLFKQTSPISGTRPKNFVQYNGKLYFEALSDTTAYELWVTNGNPDSTKMLLPAKVNTPTAGVTSPLIVAGDYMYFFARYDTGTGNELYKVSTPPKIVGIPQTTEVKISDITVYPNPTKNSITIQYMLNEAGIPTYRLYDVTGRCVASWLNESILSVGRQTKQLNIVNLPPAAYQLVVEVNGSKQAVPVVKQ